MASVKTGALNEWADPLAVRRRTVKVSVQVEKLEKNMAKLTIEVSAEDFEKAINSVYQKNKNKFR